MQDRRRFHGYYLTGYYTPYQWRSQGSLWWPNAILVSNYHGCKGEAINLLPHYLIEIIHKTIKPSHLEKL